MSEAMTVKYFDENGTLLDSDVSTLFPDETFERLARTIESKLKSNHPLVNYSGIPEGTKKVQLLGIRDNQTVYEYEFDFVY